VAASCMPWWNYCDIDTIHSGCFDVFHCCCSTCLMFCLSCGDSTFWKFYIVAFLLQPWYTIVDNCYSVWRPLLTCYICWKFLWCCDALTWWYLVTLHWAWSYLDDWYSVFLQYLLFCGNFFLWYDTLLLICHYSRGRRLFCWCWYSIRRWWYLKPCSVLFCPFCCCVEWSPEGTVMTTFLPDTIDPFYDYKLQWQWHFGILIAMPFTFCACWHISWCSTWLHGGEFSDCALQRHSWRWPSTVISGMESHFCMPVWVSVAIGSILTWWHYSDDIIQYWYGYSDILRKTTF